MSADNWTRCPKCYSDRQVAVEKLRQQFYGKIPAAEYEAKLHVVLSMPEYQDEDTLREDYQIGIRKGEFVVDYHASCQSCGYKKSFKHKEPVP